MKRFPHMVSLVALNLRRYGSIKLGQASVKIIRWRKKPQFLLNEDLTYLEAYHQTVCRNELWKKNGSHQGRQSLDCYEGLPLRNTSKQRNHAVSFTIPSKNNSDWQASKTDPFHDDPQGGSS